MATDFTRVARLLAVPARSAMVSALMEGRALTVGELARVAGVGASTASEHVAALDAGGLVHVLSQGRHRYVALAGSEVAAALEALSLVCPPVPVASLRQSREAATLRGARTCYDHLAGALGVALHDALVRQGWVVTDPAYVLTEAARRRSATSASTSTAPGRGDGRPCAPAWTGPSDGTTSPGDWAGSWPGPSSTVSGCAGPVDGGSMSPRRGSHCCGNAWRSRDQVRRGCLPADAVARDPFEQDRAEHRVDEPGVQAGHRADRYCKGKCAISGCARLGACG